MSTAVPHSRKRSFEQFDPQSQVHTSHSKKTDQNTKSAPTRVATSISTTEEQSVAKRTILQEKPLASSSSAELIYLKTRIIDKLPQDSELLSHKELIDLEGKIRKVFIQMTKSDPKYAKFALDLTPSYSARIKLLMFFGNFYLSQNKENSSGITQAIQFFQQAIDEPASPSNVKAFFHALIGDAYLSRHFLEDPDKAIAEINKGLKLEPSDKNVLGKLHVCKGNAYLFRKLPEDMSEAIDEIVKGNYFFGLSEDVMKSLKISKKCQSKPSDQEILDQLL